MSIGEAFEINPKVSIKRGAEIPFISMDRLEPGRRDTDAVETRLYSSGSKFEPGDTLMARITPCLENGKIARYLPKGQAMPAAGSTEFMVLRGRPGITRTEFAYYFAIDPTIHDLAVSLMTGTSGRQRVDVRAFAETEVQIPNLETQRAISSILGSLDDKIAANQRAASLSRQMVESIAGTTNNYVSLDELAVRNKRTINPAKLGSDLVMHYSIPRFDSGSPALEPADSIKSNKMHVERASVLVSKLNPETPRVWSIPAPSKEPLSLASTEFIVLEPSDINQSQLYAATLHSNFHHQLASLVGGTSKSHQRVKPTEMLGCVVPDVRTLTDEQIELLKTLVQIETQAIQEAETLAKTRDELLPLLMNGKITVREASQEAAAAGAPTPSEEDEV